MYESPTGCFFGCLDSILQVHLGCEQQGGVGEKVVTAKESKSIDLQHVSTYIYKYKYKYKYININIYIYMIHVHTHMRKYEHMYHFFGICILYIEV